jgi:hypothetical protein
MRNNELSMKELIDSIRNKINHNYSWNFYLTISRLLVEPLFF